MIMKTKRRNYFILTIAVMAASLTGCSKKPVPAEGSKPSTQSTVETVKPAEEIEVSSEVTPEPTVEATPEPTTEAVVYEGIDMESDLEFEEWVKTFIGVVDEPVAIIYNDNTGRKEIIQEGNTVKVNLEEDTIAVYLPEGRNMESNSDVPLNQISKYANYEILVPDAKILKNSPVHERPASITVTGGTEDWVVNFTMVVE